MNMFMTGKTAKTLQRKLLAKGIVEEVGLKR